MPTFDFSCAGCSHVFEQTIPYGSGMLPPCPSCGSQDITKLLSPPTGIIFKGSGFYKNDGSAQRTSAAKTSNESEKGSAPETPAPAPAPAPAPEKDTATPSSSQNT